MTLQEEVINGEIDNAGEVALRSLLNSLPAYFYSVRYKNGVAAGTIHSHQCEKVTGYTSSEYVRNPDLWLKMVHPDDRETVREFFYAPLNVAPSDNGGGLHHCNPHGSHTGVICACNDQGYLLEHRIIHKQGMVRWIANRLVPSRDASGNLLRLDGLVMDITDQKTSEDKLKAANEKAEATIQLKDKFISLLSHDIRTPISNITMMLKITLSNHKDSPRCDDCRTVLGRTVGVCKTMMGMADDLLESARLQGGNIRLNRKICNIKNVCDAVMEDLNYLAAKKEVVLKNEVPPEAMLYVDRVLFQRVIHNLLINALKFSNKGGTVTVFLPGGQNVLAVKDTGTGINKTLLPDLFKYEVKTTTAGTSGEQGTGFGLPMCMDIMKAHGGTMRVTSQRGEGTTLFVETPEIKPLVVVADDDEVLLFTIRRYLEDMGAEVLEAKNGAEAFKIVQDKEPALIITDLRMPLMDGFALIKSLKTGAKYSHIPVIIMTGSRTEDIDMRQKAFECKADDFITKPLAEPDFIPRINRFIAG